MSIERKKQMDLIWRLAGIMASAAGNFMRHSFFGGYLSKETFTSYSR